MNDIMAWVDTRGSWSISDLNVSSSLKNARKKMGVCYRKQQVSVNIPILEKPRSSTAIREHLLKCLPQGEIIVISKWLGHAQGQLKFKFKVFINCIKSSKEMNIILLSNPLAVQL